jgi:hypothetical protein
MDRRSQTVREVACDQVELWQALGGVEALSPQQLWLVERIVFMRRRMLAYESAVMHNAGLLAGQHERELPMTAGEYSNHANVLQGYLKTLGLKRQARDVTDLATHFARQEGATVEPGP